MEIHHESLGAVRGLGVSLVLGVALVGRGFRGAGGGAVVTRLQLGFEVLYGLRRVGLARRTGLVGFFRPRVVEVLLDHVALTIGLGDGVAVGVGRGSAGRQGHDHDPRKEDRNESLHVVTSLLRPFHSQLPDGRASERSLGCGHRDLRADQARIHEVSPVSAGQLFHVNGLRNLIFRAEAFKCGL